MKPFSYGFETIPWEQCARLVQSCEAKNRRLSASRVDTLTRAVDGGRFFATHQGIALDPKGNLIDGQHRLAAHARAKTDYLGLVCRYHDQAYAEQVMAVFDSGRTRSTADGLAIGGVMSAEDATAATAICNVFSYFFTRVTALDVQETAAFYRAHAKSIQWAIKALPPRRGGAHIRAAFALSWEVDAKKTTELAAQIDAGVGVPGSAAALWNRAHADGALTARGGRQDRFDVAKRALRILRAHVSGEPAPSKLYTDDTSLQWFMAKLNDPARAPQIEAPPPEVRLTRVEDQIFTSIPRDGIRLGALAKAVDKSPSWVRGCLIRLEQLGVVKRPSTGFYMRAAA